jgi:RimJ/RimL family protein N-acetyltransferase
MLYGLPIRTIPALLWVCNMNRRALHGKGCRDLINRPGRTTVRCRLRAPFTPRGASKPVVSQAIVEPLPVLVRDGIRLREVHLSDAAALTALFQLPEVSKHLDPPPATIADFGNWISLSQSRRAEDRAVCYTLITGKEEISGLFMALRFDDRDCAEIGFAIAPQFWGTGVFQSAIDVYLDFLFNDWGVKTLIGKTQISNVRALGAMRRLGAKVVAENERNGQREYVWQIER